ncbi:unnamed protein product [Effrenium voratum]|uniref:PX domain-containing protein n=1 Tax=Effrenium voratum TaxID=2562239 RepID=A0AA36HXZ6_9DINO|nr:unnamed protein product [Effrenium voratum]CAJ1377412.1 unnamed protein product [Effrenium voratum]CAJ1453469.1 unnamed protein product [Effrenium voratum]
MVVKIELTDHQEVDGVVWYDVQVTNESGRTWTLQRRYNDFLSLDEELRKAESLEVPSLPGKQSLNPLKMLDKDGFLTRRKEGLRAYLHSLAAQIQTTQQDPVLEKFLQVDLSSKPSGDMEPGPSTSVEFTTR